MNPMLPEDAFFATLGKNGIWQRYCGFLDLSPADFLEIQERLLLEQVGLVAHSPLGRLLMNGRRPNSAQEFRDLVPLTTYQDYAPHIGNGQNDGLAIKPHYWVHTSWSQGTFKRVPWAYHFHEKQIRNIISSLILASASRKGDIRVAPGLKLLAIVPDRPFVSGHLAYGLQERFTVNFLPPLELSHELPFHKRVAMGLELALATDIDCAITMTSSFLPIEREFHRMKNERKLPSLSTKLHPLVACRLAKAILKRKFQPRHMLLPKDVWAVKGIIGWGAETDALQNTIRNKWGKDILQLYGSSEAGMMAIQDWHRNGMTFLPDSVYFEFIPQSEIYRGKDAETVMLDELEEGKAYEPVITSFYGMPFLRYRQGDLVRVVSGGDRERLPRMVFQSRADDIIDLLGIARLNTDTVRQALELAGITHGQWSMRKEHDKDKPVLRLYIELDSESQACDLERRLNRILKGMDRHYQEAIIFIKDNPVKVFPLIKGTFERYLQRKNGHNPELCYLPQMNLPDAAVEELTQLGDTGNNPNYLSLKG